ncbi:MAG: hypothetical protein QM613_00150 [Micrococcaceae bacterium]
MTSGASPLARYVEDRSLGHFKDFMVSPVKRWQLVTSYMLTSFAVSFTFLLLVMIAGLTYIASHGHSNMNFGGIIVLLMRIILFNVLSNGSFLVVFSYFKSSFRRTKRILDYSFRFPFRLVHSFG